ncbi:hypothetical protein L1987_15919 [Smallanthus sonchifolius]|uniref:Uncharacterized protein n=1 Tax=Smallanthus sonchifolius TaxID=185202 RepID=A0ACB9J7W9_9ASTR|nr:hypothetical protein L1987_15919 [Smallanthus sonchifolius]
MSQEHPIKYGDVFPVSGELANKPVAPQDAAMMQAAETTVFGQTQKGGTAAAMQAAATINERAGLVSHEDLTVTDDQGVTVTATELPGARVVTETVAGQVVGRYTESTPVLQQGGGVGDVYQQGAITIGEALKATARTAGNKTVEQSDAAAIQAAEDAAVKLPADKTATREDAEGVLSAERRNNPDMTAHPAGVSASIAAAANLNEKELVS